MNRLRRLLLLSPLLAAPAVLRIPPAVGQALWPGARFTAQDRAMAVRRGLRFIYRTALPKRNLIDWGHDYLWLFYSVSAAAADPALKEMAWTMGRERARAWRRLYREVPGDASAGDLARVAVGSYSADLLDVPDPGLKRQIMHLAGRFSPADYYGFDPSKEPPPNSLPADDGEGDDQNAYDLLALALVHTFLGDGYGVRLGASFPDVMQWLPRLRPYRGYDGGRNEQFQSISYLVSHVVYTLSRYCLYRMNKDWLPAEYQFLADNVLANIEADDVELIGEFLDTLRVFGMTMADARLRAGTEFLLKRQNDDGSWGAAIGEDIYARYHPTWSAVCGLMDFNGQGEKVTSEEALRRAQNGPAR
jgi:hypothetical protein